MSNLFDALKEKLGGLYCRSIDAQEWIVNAMAQAFEDVEYNGLPAGELAQLSENLYYQWRATACGIPPTGSIPPFLTSDFQGGQCDAPYRVDLSIPYLSSRFGPGVSTPSFNVTGPISAIEVYEDSGAPGFSPSLAGISIRITHGGGVLEQIYAVNAPGSLTITGAVTKTVTRTDGQADNCGDPGARLNPTDQPYSFTEDVEYTDENGDSQLIPGVDFNLSPPIINPDGSISIPYEVCIGTICFTGVIDIGEQFNVIPDNPLDPVEDADEKTKLDEALDKLCEVLDKLEELETGQDFHVTAFGEEVDRLSGVYLSFKCLDTEAERFPRSTSQDVRYPYVLPNCKTDITVEDLAQIELKKGDVYCWVDPENVSIKGHLFKAYFASEDDGYSTLGMLYSLTNYSASNPSHMGKSERQKPKKPRQQKTLKITQAVLYDSDNDEVLKVFTSADFQDYYAGSTG